MFGLRTLSRNQQLGGWALTLPVLVVITLAGIACGRGDSDGDPGPRDVDIPDEAIGLLPSDWGRYSLFEVAQLLDEGPPDHADAFEDFWGETLDRAGVPIDDVEFIAEARGEWAEHVVVLQGSFDFDAVRDHLTDTDMEEEEYRGFELWKGSGPEVAYEVALMEDGGFILPGSGGVSMVLRRLSREVGLLEYEDESGVQELLDRVGDGWLRQVWTGTDCLHVGVRRCEGSAWALTPVGRGTDVEVTWAFTFRDERSARMEMEDIEEAFDDIDVLDLEDIDSDGRHVVVSGVLEDHDWQDGGAWALEHLAQAAVPAVPVAPTQAPAAPAPAAAPTAAPAAPTSARTPVPAPPASPPPTAEPVPSPIGPQGPMVSSIEQDGDSCIVVRFTEEVFAPPNLELRTEGGRPLVIRGHADADGRTPALELKFGKYTGTDDIPAGTTITSFVFWAEGGPIRDRDGNHADSTFEPYTVPADITCTRTR